MRTSSLITAVAFASLVLYASAASACPWNDAQAQGGDPAVVAAASPSQPSMPATTPQTPPSSAN